MECDLHTHSLFSFDGVDSVDALCLHAIDAGLRAIAITDHCDVDGIVSGYYAPYDPDAALAAVEAAREKYRGRLQVLFGVELGQPYICPEYSAALLRDHAFDFVIGSLHNLVGVPDFYYLNAAALPVRQVLDLFLRAIEETERLLVPFAGIDTVAHITYPLRYFRKAGRSIDLTEAEEPLRSLFRAMANRSLALEVNSSGLRDGVGTTLPEQEIIRMFLQEGGRCVTVGSDAHRAADVGAGIGETLAMLASIGVPELLTFREGKKCRLPLTSIL